MQKTTNILAAGSVGLLLIVALMTVGDALLRTYFTSPIIGVSEVAELLSLVAVAGFIPLSLQRRHHLSIDFVAGVFGPRIYRLLGIFGSSVALAFFAVVVWRLLIHSLDLAQSGASTWFLAWPLAPWWLVATGFLALCLPVQFLVVLSEIRDGDKADGAEAPAHGLDGEAL
ncbi:TRAP transporter small permease [Oricola indica]|uniref:TRAP transporter small permease n=1 Tax=Oricola indica TaxID=2872591 RepID=UPI003CCB8A33